MYIRERTFLKGFVSLIRRKAERTDSVLIGLITRVGSQNHYLGIGI